MSTWNPKKFEQLTETEQGQVVEKGLAWYGKHKQHVTALMKYATDTDCKPYAPSGSDMFHPELFKPAHWSWFIGKFVNKK